MWVPWVYKEAPGKASEVRGECRAELQEERMTHDKGGSVPDGLHGKAKATEQVRQAPNWQRIFGTE